MTHSERRYTGDRARVIVLNHQDVAMFVEDLAQRTRAPLVQRRAGGILRPRRQHAGRGPTVQHALEVVGQ